MEWGRISRLIFNLIKLKGGIADQIVEYIVFDLYANISCTVYIYWRVMFFLDKFFTDAFELDFVLAGLYSMCKLLVFERVD